MIRRWGRPLEELFLQPLGLVGVLASGVLAEEPVQEGEGLGLPSGGLEALGDAEEDLVEPLVVGVVGEDPLVAQDGGTPGLPALLVEPPHQALGSGQAFPALPDARPRLLDLGGARVEVEEPLVLAERLLGRGLVAVGAVLLLVVGLRHQVLGEVGPGVGRVEGEELPEGGDREDVVAGPALLEVALAEAEPGPRPVLAVGKAVHDPLVVLPGVVPLLLLVGLRRRVPHDGVGAAGQRRGIDAAARAASEGGAEDEGRGSPHSPLRIHSHSFRRPSRSETVERNARSRRAAVVSANVSLMSPFWASSWTMRKVRPVTSSIVRSTSRRARRSPPPTLYTEPGRPETAAARAAATTSATYVKSRVWRPSP